MSAGRPRVALVSATEAIPLDTDLPLLAAALEREGVVPTVVAWDDVSAAWPSFDLALVRSAWDYVPRRDEFLAWARALPCPLANSADVLTWNTDKVYLRELESRGVAIVPTTWVEAGASATGLELLSSGDVVVKPSVSAGAKDTARYPVTARAAIEAHVARITAGGRTAMVQPYIGSVDRRGETALLFFGGAFSHAIEKSALLLEGASHEVTGLFAPERITPREPTARERAFAESVLAAIPADLARGLLYARVDVVEGESETPRVLKLELTEPSTFLDTDAGAADRFARAVRARLTSPA